MNVASRFRCHVDVLRRSNSVQKARREGAALFLFAAHLLNPVCGEDASQLSDDCLRQHERQSCCNSLVCFANAGRTFCMKVKHACFFSLFE